MYDYSDSEFGGSDAEDIEFGLYRQLYFGSSENITALTSVPLSTAILNSELTSRPIKNDEEAGGLQTQLDRFQEESVPLPLIPVAVTDKGTSADNLPMRERTISVCSILSVESISGKIPLDNLYCTDLDDDFFIEDSLTLEKQKLSPESSDCDNDSKCSSLIQLRQNKKGEGNKKCKFDDIEVVTPPPCKPITTVEIDSDSDDSIAIVAYTSSQSNRSAKNTPKNVKNNKQNVRILQSTPVVSQSKIVGNDFDKIKVSPILKNKNNQLPVPISKRRSEECPKLIEVLSSEEEAWYIDSDSDDSSVSSEDFDPSLSIPLSFNISNISKTSNPAYKKLKKNKRSCNKVLQRSQAIYTKDRPLTTKDPSCSKWSQEMASFYDSDLSDELTVEEIHSMQSDEPSLWSLEKEDLLPRTRFRYFNREVRCLRCKEFGHHVKDCLQIPHCLYCASENHVDINKCPSNCCLRCGGAKHKYCKRTSFNVICEICGWRGHDEKLCPDTWRRYHLTTSGSSPVIPESDSSVEDINRIQCFICSLKGHYGHMCNMRPNNQPYVIVPRDIFNYSNNDTGIYSEEGYKEHSRQDFDETLSTSDLTSQCSPIRKNRKKIKRLLTRISKRSGAKIENTLGKNLHAGGWHLSQIVVTGSEMNCGNAANLIKNDFNADNFTIETVITDNQETSLDNLKSSLFNSNKKSNNLDFNALYGAKQNTDVQIMSEKISNADDQCTKISKKAKNLQKSPGNNIAKTNIDTTIFCKLKGWKMKYCQTFKQYLRMKVKEKTAVKKIVFVTKTKLNPYVLVNITGLSEDCKKASKYIHQVLFDLRTGHPGVTNQTVNQKNVKKIQQSPIKQKNSDSKKSVICLDDNDIIEPITLPKEKKNQTPDKVRTCDVTVYHKILQKQVKHFQSNASELRTKIEKEARVELVFSKKAKEGKFYVLSIVGPLKRCVKAQELIQSTLSDMGKLSSSSSRKKSKKNMPLL